MAEITDDMLSVLDQSSGALGLLECVEISHPNWASTLRYVINSSEPVTVTHEDSNAYEYVYSPITIQRSNDEETLDQMLTLTIGDVGEQVPDLIDQVIADAVIVQPVVNYRAYFIGQYDAPCFIAKNLLVESVTRTWEGTRIDAQAEGLNDTGTGDVYSASTDKSLIGFY